MRKTLYEYGVTYRAKHKEEIKLRKQATKVVNAARSRKYRLDNLESVKAKEKARRTNNKANYLLKSARSRAKKLKIDFSISLSDMPDIGTHCPALGIKYIFETSMETKDFSPSLDRIDSTKGYIPGNIQVISWRANRLKSNSCLEELEKLVQYLKIINHDASQ